MEMLRTIALLCQLNGQGDWAATIEQLKCQQYYIKCLNTEINSNYKTLSKCVLERKL
jgi:hypothetical protein